MLHFYANLKEVWASSCMSPRVPDDLQALVKIDQRIFTSAQSAKKGPNLLLLQVPTLPLPGMGLPSLNFNFIRAQESCPSRLYYQCRSISCPAVIDTC